ncbi:hypothetical protein GGR51DRAFT_566327 [Nemania sp. FL0031]|nr:hypothetical protein GGR51DRAFT_566327 [Nemania sp. FL0031]
MDQGFIDLTPRGGPAGRHNGAQHGPSGAHQQGFARGHSPAGPGLSRNINPPNLGRGPAVQISDITRDLYTESDKKEELTDYVVVRFEKVADRDSYDEQGQPKRLGWEKALRAEDHGISKQVAARKVLELNRLTKNVLDKKDSLPPPLKLQIDKTLADLMNRELDPNHYHWVLAQMDHQLRKLEPVYYHNSNQQYYVPTRRHRSSSHHHHHHSSSSSKRRRSHGESSHHHKKRMYERLSLTAYFKRVPRPGVDIHRLWINTTGGLEGRNYAQTNNGFHQTQQNHQSQGHQHGNQQGGHQRDGHQHGAHPHGGQQAGGHPGRNTPGGPPPSGRPSGLPGGRPAGPPPGGHPGGHRDQPPPPPPLNRPGGGQAARPQGGIQAHGQRPGPGPGPGPGLARAGVRHVRRNDSDSDSDSDSELSRGSSRSRHRRGETPPSSVSDHNGRRRSRSYTREPARPRPHPHQHPNARHNDGYPGRAPAPPYRTGGAGSPTYASTIERIREGAYQRGVRDAGLAEELARLSFHDRDRDHRGDDAELRREYEARAQRGSVFSGDPFGGSTTASSSSYGYSTDGRGRSRGPPVGGQRHPLSPRLPRGRPYY